MNEWYIQTMIVSILSTFIADRFSNESFQINKSQPLSRGSYNIMIIIMDLCIQDQNF